MNSRFSALDAIRGLAAVAVMLLHYAGHNGLSWMPRAWMAVDLFFILSGFVLMHSYSQKIGDGRLDFLAFFKIRLTRLMPLYLVGLFLGYLSMTYSCRLPGGSCEAHVLPAVVYGMFMLPYFTEAMWPFGTNFEQIIFPLNGPAWSLLFELLVNLLFFYWIAIWKRQHLWLVISIAFITLVGAYFFKGSVNGGWGENNFLVGFPRVIYHFFIGVLIYTMYLRFGLKSKPVAYISVVCLLIFFAINSSLTSMFSLFILAPFIVLANAKITFSGYTENICTWLGDISYPLYIVHWPIFQLLYMFGYMENLPSPLRVIAMGLVTVILAWLLGIADKNIRVKLSKISGASLKVQVKEP
jgi:peptidoglycan/LPS O-acetylase OafA/YrhL